VNRQVDQSAIHLRPAIYNLPPSTMCLHGDPNYFHINRRVMRPVPRADTMRYGSEWRRRAYLCGEAMELREDFAGPGWTAEELIRESGEEAMWEHLGVALRKREEEPVDFDLLEHARVRVVVKQKQKQRKGK
jgi:hypothetical protein